MLLKPVFQLFQASPLPLRPHLQFTRREPAAYVGGRLTCRFRLAGALVYEPESGAGISGRAGRN